MRHYVLAIFLAAWPLGLSAQAVTQTQPQAGVGDGSQLLVDPGIANRTDDVTASQAPDGAEQRQNDDLAAAEPEPETAIAKFTTDLRPPARSGDLPRTRWQHMSGHSLWTRAALSALKDHGKPLVDLVPTDIQNWCPAYPTASDAQRRAFWVGFMSALAKHESTYKPWAVGGGGKWYGLLQILPGTARGYKCNVGTGEALKKGAANLSCAVRIMAHTVPRDGVIHGYKNRKGRGVTADWGPMHNAAKRRDMAGWLRRQTYCQTLDATRPKPRP